MIRKNKYTGARENKSKTYLLPLLLDVVNFDLKTYYKYIKNTYVSDLKNEYQNCLFVEIAFDFETPDFIKFEHSLKQNELFVKSYDLSEDSVIYVFNFPEDYLDEYNWFLDGKYSQFSKSAKELIYLTHRRVYSDESFIIQYLVYLKQVLDRGAQLRKTLNKRLKVNLPEYAELESISDIINETINLEKNESKHIVPG